MRLLRVITIALVGIVSPPFAAGANADPAADPIEGKWYGMAGFKQDRVAIGFEFKRDEKGAIIAYLYQPVINFYGLALPGAVALKGDKYALDDWRMNMTRKGDALSGTMFFNNVPFALKRTDRLPSETPVPELSAGPGPKWQTKLSAPIYARAAVRDGTAYVGTSGGMFYAIALSNGAFTWAFAAGRPVHGEALASDDGVYFVCDNGFLFRLDRKTGKETWRYDLGDAQVARVLPHQVVDNSGDFDFDTNAPKPVLENGVLYVGSGDGSLHAVDAVSGKRVWRFQGQGKIRGDAAVDGERIMFGTFDNFAYGIDKKTGTQLWRKDTGGPITGSVAMVAGALIVGNRYGVLAALDPKTGTVNWRTQMWGSAVESTAVPAEKSFFYIGSSDLRRVSMMDAKDGRVVWRTDVLGWAWARPEIAGKRLFVSAGGSDPYQMRHLGGFLALDRENGKILWRWSAPENRGTWDNGFVASPAAAGNVVVVGGLDGSLYAFPAD